MKPTRQEREFLLVLARNCFDRDWDPVHDEQEKFFSCIEQKINLALELAYLAARGTSHLDDPSFTRSQMYWKGRADAAEDVKILLREGRGDE